MTGKSDLTAVPGPNGPVVDFDALSYSTRETANRAWKELRGQCPVAWTEHNGGHWVVSKYDEVAAAYRDWETFSSERLVDREHSAMAIQPIKMPTMLPQELDPPLFHPYRRILAELLAPGAVARMLPRVQHWVTYFVDEVVESGECDLANDLTSPVTGAVVLEYLGFPFEDWRRISSCLHGLSGNVPGTPDFEVALGSFQWLMGRVAELVADRRREPRDDAISYVVSREIEGEPIRLEDAASVVRLTIAGGVDTTTSLTTSALVHLHHHLDDRRALIDDPTLIESATEEFLRLYAPARSLARTVAKDTEFGGCTMHRGDRVMPSVVSACHDEEAFPDADRFVMDRFPNRHLAFGMGLHRCPGAHLARAEFKEMMTQILARIPDYRILEDGLVENPVWISLGGWARCPAVFTPGERIGA